ncbi:hypothetical protein TNCV_4534261 [Trichonephila clavipes]|nr:hypothetical protein TNCV_4534261 [Trichonephila clavipes]
MEWRHTSSAVEVKAKQTLSKRKNMATVLWDRRGVLLANMEQRSVLWDRRYRCFAGESYRIFWLGSFGPQEEQRGISMTTKKNIVVSSKGRESIEDNQCVGPPSSSWNVENVALVFESVHKNRLQTLAQISDTCCALLENAV